MKRTLIDWIKYFRDNGASDSEAIRLAAHAQSEELKNRVLNLK